MTEIASAILAALVTKWHRRSAGIAAAALAGAGQLWFLVRDQKLSDSIWPYLVSLATALIVYGGWWLSHRPPRAGKGRLGFVVAIACEHDGHERQVRADFIEHLRKNLEADVAANKIQLLVYPRWLTRQMLDESRPDAYRVRSRAHFIVYGRVRLRTDASGKLAHYLDLEGGVWHGSADEAVRQTLTTEFVQTLPRKVVIANDASVFRFEAASDWLEMASRYIIGLAAAVFGDLEYAEALLLSVEQRLPSVAARRESLKGVAPRLANYLKSLYQLWAAWLYTEFVRTRDVAMLPQLESVTQKLLARDPTNYAAHLAKAICEFLIHDDTRAAIATLKRCKKASDPTWRYSLAFLYAYEGDLKRAEQEYLRAFRATPSDKTVPVQSEEFIQLVLERQPLLSQLHYCSGLINYHVKKDLEAARRDFETFLLAPSSEGFPYQRVRADELLMELSTHWQVMPIAEVERDLQLRQIGGAPIDLDGNE